MENKKNLQSFNQLWMRFKLLLIEMVKHVKEIFNVGKFLMRNIVLPSNSVSIGIGSDGGNEAK